MNEFSKLSREEMKKITGGVPPVCRVDGACGDSFQINGHWVVLYGVCLESLETGCGCDHGDYGKSPNESCTWPE